MGLAIDWGQDYGPQHIMITGASKEPLNFGNSRIGALRPAYEAFKHLRTTPSADACSLARTAYMKLPQTCKKLAEAESGS